MRVNHQLTLNCDVIATVARNRALILFQGLHDDLKRVEAKIGKVLTEFNSAGLIRLTLAAK